jgi:hypothetical protein
VCVETGIDDQRDCDDGNACTTGDWCEAGACVGDVVGCEDGNPCTDDSCDPATGCLFQANEAPCDDEDPCTVTRCSGGACAVLSEVAGCCRHHDECPDPFAMCDPAEHRCVEVQCRACAGDADCGPVGNRCLAMESGDWCVVGCLDDDCPEGASCAVWRDAEALCLPDGGECVPADPEPVPEPLPEPLPDTADDAVPPVEPTLEPVPDAAVPIESVPEPIPEPIPEPVPDVIGEETPMPDAVLLDVARDAGQDSHHGDPDLSAVDVRIGVDGISGGASGTGCTAVRSPGNGAGGIGLIVCLFLLAGARMCRRRVRIFQGFSQPRP